MKVYALREMVTSFGYMSIRGFHSSLTDAKKQAKQLFDRSAEWDVVSLEVQSTWLKEDIIALFNGDSPVSHIEGKVPMDFAYDPQVVFENPALKRYRKEENTK